MSEDYTTHKPCFPGQEPVNEDPKKSLQGKMTNKEAADALQKVVDGVFDGEGPRLEIDKDSHQVRNVCPNYATQVSFHVDDVMEHVTLGDLDPWVKRNMSEALRALSELIMEKVAELDG